MTSRALRTSSSSCWESWVLVDLSPACLHSAEAARSQQGSAAGCTSATCIMRLSGHHSTMSRPAPCTGASLAGPLPMDKRMPAASCDSVRQVSLTCQSCAHSWARQMVIQTGCPDACTHLALLWIAVVGGGWRVLSSWSLLESLHDTSSCMVCSAMHELWPRMCQAACLDTGHVW